MRQFSSPRVDGLEFTMYDDGSGSAEYKGKKVGSVDLQTKEIKLEGDTWTPYPYESRLLDMFIEQAERYAINNLNAEKQFAAEVVAIDDPLLSFGDKVIISLDNIREDDVFDYIERSDLLSRTMYSSVTELMYNTVDYNTGLSEDSPTLNINIVSGMDNEPKLYIIFNDGLSCPTAEVPLSEKERTEINAFIKRELGCSASEYIEKSILRELSDEKKFEKLLREVPHDETTAFWREVSKLDEYNDKSAAKKHYDGLVLNLVKSAKLNKAAAAELLLTSDMITIAELSPYFLS